MTAYGEWAAQYDDDLLGTYRSRYLLFTLVLVVLGVLAVVLGPAATAHRKEV